MAEVDMYLAAMDEEESVRIVRWANFIKLRNSKSYSYKIIKLFEEHPDGMQRHQIAKHLGVRTKNIAASIQNLISRGVIEQKDGGKYFITDPNLNQGRQGRQQLF